MAENYYEQLGWKSIPNSLTVPDVKTQLEKKIEAIRRTGPYPHDTIKNNRDPIVKGKIDEAKLAADSLTGMVNNEEELKKYNDSLSETHKNKKTQASQAEAGTGRPSSLQQAHREQYDKDYKKQLENSPYDGGYNQINSNKLVMVLNLFVMRFSSGLPDPYKPISEENAKEIGIKVDDPAQLEDLKSELNNKFGNKVNLIQDEDGNLLGIECKDDAIKKDVLDYIDKKGMLTTPEEQAEAKNIADQKLTAKLN